MLTQADAERIVAEELEAEGHRVLRVNVCWSIHLNQQPWPALVAICLGEVNHYDCIAAETLDDEPALRSFVRDHWLPETQ